MKIRYWAASLFAYTVTVTLLASTAVYADSEKTVQGSILPAIAKYYDPAQGVSSVELVRRTINSNVELSAIRLDVERARARVQQAGLRPNPSVDFEHTTGRFTGSTNESETALGVSLPIELGGKRRGRIELAEAELAAAEAEVADRERRLANDVRSAYAEALAALRELEVTENLTELDNQTVRIVDVRVKEGDAAPLELSLLRTELERLRSRRALIEGRLQTALLRLKSLAGIPVDEPLRLREDLSQPITLIRAPATVEVAIEQALQHRPDLRLARLNEEVAAAGLKLARAQATPDLTAFTRYSRERSSFDNTPVGPIRDKDNKLTFGVSINIPLFNRNQGATAEAITAIKQAERRREFIEQMIRAEVSTAYARLQAAQEAVQRFEQEVIPRSNRNISAFREVYNLGEIKAGELVNQQRRVIESQREFIEALTERYRALSDLQSAIGANAAGEETK